MVPSASVLACRREERVQKAVSVNHHGPGDARLSAVLNPLSGAECDYVGPILSELQIAQYYSNTYACNETILNMGFRQ